MDTHFREDNGLKAAPFLFSFLSNFKFTTELLKKGFEPSVALGGGQWRAEHGWRGKNA